MTISKVVVLGADDNALAAGTRAVFYVGGNMQIFVDLTGATDPDVTISFSEVS